MESGEIMQEEKKVIALCEKTTEEVNIYEKNAEVAIAQIEDAYLTDLATLKMPKTSFDAVDEIETDLDAMDLIVCFLAMVASTFIATNEQAEAWLAGVHDAASKKSGDYDVVQKALGLLLEHSGDAMDYFKTRDGQNSWGLFHRLLWGHDPLAFGKTIMPHNPFIMMIEQKDSILGGSLQALRHLVADTFSKQGLPLPGSSFLDCSTEDGRPWNYIITIVQELSESSYDNKAHAEQLYEHLFTIRAQDISGGMAATAIVATYIKLRCIKDELRQTQLKIVAYAMSFYAEAVVGMVRQEGIPYINHTLGAAMAGEVVKLLYQSNKRTSQLEAKTNELLEDADEQISKYNALKELL